MEYIKVYNYTSAPVILHGRLGRDYTVPAATMNAVGMEEIPVEDVTYIAGKTNVFTTGLLTFDDADIDEIMDLLRIPNWRNKVITKEQIRDAILRPNLEKMQRFLSLTQPSDVDRYRDMLFRIQAEGQYGVSERVARIIHERFNELANGITSTRIMLTQAGFTQAVEDNTVDELRKTIEELQAKIASLSQTQPEPDHEIAKDAEPDTKRQTRKKTTPKKTERADA